MIRALLFGLSCQGFLPVFEVDDFGTARPGSKSVMAATESVT
ncbi:hypothetical protein SAMN05421642_102539 [Rhodococcoides kyotonense]|uniref:Uncharacterized protein n=1 Tax=Rhodococcoides kyotonense TaxID=398843 RepID=A0A239ES75_9NOCA|nr:hypothetical protein SAMN05421642_102539 [Rhodococcus kyotonensis]